MQQVLCTLSHAGSDVRCAVCGQGFLVYWSRFTRADQAEYRRVIQERLRDHHIDAKDPGADRRIHPREPFHVDRDQGPGTRDQGSGAALLTA